LTEDNQYLSDEARKQIRSDIYSNKRYSAKKDGKILFFVKFCRDKDVLDLGCVDHDPKNEQSTLWLHGAIKNVASSILGLDFYQKGVDYLVKKGYDVIFANAQNFDFDRKYDVIAAGDLIEHVENPGLMFSCVAKHLKIGGIFVISTPNPWCWKYTLYFWIFSKMDKINQEHVAWYCPETLRLLGSRYGFSVKEIEYTSRRFWEKIIPLPASMRATTINLAYEKTSTI
jgi:2-polyprenyl-3-methyl-5-hydroxy-6-metoxy-1,4-benzoquinol methylase